MDLAVSADHRDLAVLWICRLGWPQRNRNKKIIWLFSRTMKAVIHEGDCDTCRNLLSVSHFISAAHLQCHWKEIQQISASYLNSFLWVSCLSFSDYYWLPIAVACNGGHTLGTGFGELAKPGEGNRRVSNHRWVRIWQCQPYCMRSLTPSGTIGRVHLKSQRLWRRWQQLSLECLEQDVAPKEVLVIHWAWQFPVVTVLRATGSRLPRQREWDGPCAPVFSL